MTFRYIIPQVALFPYLHTGMEFLFHSIKKKKKSIPVHKSLQLRSDKEFLYVLWFILCFLLD